MSMLPRWIHISAPFQVRMKLSFQNIFTNVPRYHRRIQVRTERSSYTVEKWGIKLQNKLLFVLKKHCSATAIKFKFCVYIREDCGQLACYL